MIPLLLAHIPARLDALRARGWTDAPLRTLRGENVLRAWRAAARTGAER